MSINRAIAALSRARDRGLTTFTTRHHNFSRNVHHNPTSRYQILAGSEVGPNKEILYESLRNSESGNIRIDQAIDAFKAVFRQITIKPLAGSLSEEFFEVECKS